MGDQAGRARILASQDAPRDALVWSPAATWKLSGASASGTGMTLTVGDKAPNFTLPRSTGEPFTLSDVVGQRTVVLFFYPKDDTPGCTVEACTFRDNYEAFVEAGAEVVGVSSDSGASHDALREQAQAADDAPDRRRTARCARSTASVRRWASSRAGRRSSSTGAARSSTFSRPSCASRPTWSRRSRWSRGSSVPSAVPARPQP